MILGVTVMKKKKEKNKEKKLKGIVVTPESSHEELKKNLIKIFERTRFYRNKRVTPKINQLRWSKFNPTFV